MTLFLVTLATHLFMELGHATDEIDILEWPAGRYETAAGPSARRCAPSIGTRGDGEVGSDLSVAAQAHLALTQTH